MKTGDFGAMNISGIRQAERKYAAASFLTLPITVKLVMYPISHLYCPY